MKPAHLVDACARLVDADPEAFELLTQALRERIVGLDSTRAEIAEYAGRAAGIADLMFCMYPHPGIVRIESLAPDAAEVRA